MNYQHSVNVQKIPYDIDSINSDFYTLDYFLQDNVCRLCWNKEAVNAIVSKIKDDHCTIKNNLVDKIRDCLDIDIRDDSYPKNACRNCSFKIEEFHIYKTFCRETNKRLQAILNGALKIDAGTSIKVKTEMTEANNQSLDRVTKFDNFEETTNLDNLNFRNEESDIVLSIKKKKRSKRLVCKSKSNSTDISDHVSDYQVSDNERLGEEKELTSAVKKTKIKMKKAIIHTKRLKHLNLEKETNTEKKGLITLKKKNYKPKRSISYCNICRADLGSKEKLSLHNSFNHGIEEGNIFKCFGCEKRFKTRKARLAHEINFCKGLKEGYKCGKCERFLPRRSMYEAHMRDHRENPMVELPEKIFQCAKCYTLFKTKLCLKEHMSVHNNGKKNYVCETCGRIFTRQDYLHKHKLTHTGTKQHVCPHCGYRTSQKSSLTVHIRKHTGERPYICDLCPQRCISSSNLRAHTRRHLGQKKFECTICNKKFGYKISLEEHIASIHERSQSFPCEHCGAIYTRTRGLRRHLLAKHAKQDKDKDSPTDVATCREKDNSDLYLKITGDEAKKVESKENEVFQIKESDGFVLLNADNTVLLTKMY